MPDIETALMLQDNKTQPRKIEESEWSISVSSNAAAYRKQMRGWESFSYQGPDQDLPELFKPAVPTAAWYAECAVTGATLMNHCVDVHPYVRGGRPVLKGTTFTVADVLAELSETNGVEEVAQDFSLKAKTIRDLLGALSLLFERTF